MQSAAATFRRSGVRPKGLDDERQRIFDAVVRPERQKANGDVEAERGRLQKEIERAEKMLANERFVANAPPLSSTPSARSSSATAVSSTRSRTDELEAVAYEFWRAPEVEELDGWRLRFGYGITGRANSVWPNGEGTLPLDEKIDRAEAWYRERGLATLFQLTAAARPAGLDAALARRGYELRGAPVSVETASLDDVLARTSGDAELTRHADDAWLELWAGSRGFADLAAARELLELGTRRSRAYPRRRRRPRRRPPRVARHHVDGHAAGGAPARPRARDRQRARALGGRPRLHARAAPGREHERAGARAVREHRVRAAPRVPLPQARVTATAWVASLSPWPEEFGLGRMHALLEALGDPQRAFRSVHVVGTNGKSTATRTIAALLRADGLSVGAYTSPHVSGWHERLDTDPESFERAVARVRAAAESVGATQFETLTAAAFADFAARGVDAAVVEAGLGGRLDATNVLDAPVVLLTNVGLEHTDVLGDTRDEIAREKLAVVRPGATAVLPSDEWRELVPEARVVIGGAREAAEAFAGHTLEREASVALPGTTRASRPGRDPRRRAHARGRRVAPGPDRAAGLDDRRLDPPGQGRGRDAPAPRVGRPNAHRDPKQQPARARRGALAARAEPYFDRVEAVAEPEDALARGRELGPVLVTGSLYLLADLHDSR